MKIKLMTIILMVFCLAVSTQLVILCSGSGGVQNVGGDFGRAWLSNYLAQNPRPAAPGNNSTSSNNTTADWGGSPKGTTDLSSNLVKPQNTTVANTDWLGSSTITGDQTSLTNTSNNGAAQQQTYFASGTISPVHQIDASFNQSAVNPQPDSNGLIDGYPAESYYSIGPALFNF